MNTLLWVLVGVLVYSLVAKALQIRGYLPDAIRLQGPIATIHTRRGRALLTRLASPKRFWRAYSNVGVGVALVIMAGMFALLLFQALTILRNPPAPSAVNQPQNFLVVPGVNDFLPLAVAPEILFGLLVGLVVHEGGHGLLCRVEDIDIESMGVVFLALIPIGAFVEPDEGSQTDANRGARTRMFAAGVTNNFLLTAVAFALLFGPVIGAVGVAPGVAVDGAYEGSPAATAGIDHGDRITAVAGTEVSNEGDLDDALLAAENRTVAVEVDGERTVRVERSLTVVGSVGDNPANLTVESGDEPIRVTAVNGTPVATRGEFRSAVANSTFARVETTAGERTIPVGAYVTRVAPDGPLANATAPTNGSLIVTGIGGERVTSSTDLARVLDGYDPGDRVPVRTYQDGEFETHTVTLGENPRDGNGFIGVDIFPGTSGLLITDFGVRTYPAGTYLELLGGSGGSGGSAASPFAGLVDSPFTLVYVALVLPLASVVLGIPNFPGFTPAVTNFYVVEGPLAPLGDGVYILANTLFWAAWVNLQLGLFNCIPGYPLDGGRILRMCAEAVVSRLPVSDSSRVVRTITTSIGLTMLASLILMIFGPRLLG